jgi:cold-inducible RNA-binding protein
MPNKLYVGNLAFTVGESELEAFFAESGVKTEKVELIRDTFSGKSRGFAFVQLQPGEDMQAAIKATDGKDLGGRQMTVNEARERPQGSRGGGGGGRPFGGGGGGRGGGGGSRGGRGGGGGGGRRDF